MEKYLRIRQKCSTKKKWMMLQKPKYIFFGTPRFAEVILRELVADGMLPLAVVTNPDKPIGRKQIITPPPVKTLAIKAGIPVLQPEQFDAEFLKNLSEYGADFFIVSAYGKILPPELLAIPPQGVLGIHPSLLPRYRGPSPIQTVILEGDKQTGVTLYILDEEIDHGPILGQEILNLTGTETYSELSDSLAVLGAQLILKLLPKYLRGELKPLPQDHAKATFTKKFKTSDGFVDLGKDDPEIIARKVRALSEEPGVYTLRNGKRVKLLAVEKRLDGWVVTKIQREGKTPQSEIITI
jgi:methionyl-tRNA formyltransferase